MLHSSFLNRMAQGMHSFLAVIGIIAMWLTAAYSKEVLPLPDLFKKTTRCRMVPHVVSIAKQGCIKQNIVTNICVGGCFSYFIPQQDSDAVGTCSLCQPASFGKVKLSMICRNKGKFYKTEEQITVIKSCACVEKAMPCKKI